MKNAQHPKVLHQSGSLFPVQITSLMYRKRCVYVTGEGWNWWDSNGRLTSTAQRACLCTEPLLNEREKDCQFMKLNGDRSWRNYHGFSTDLPSVITENSMGRDGHSLQLLMFQICKKTASDWNFVPSASQLYHCHPLLRKVFFPQKLIDKNCLFKAKYTVKCEIPPCHP